MSFYKIFTLILIFAVTCFCAVKCIDQLSFMPYLYTAGCLSCGLLVLFAGGKKKCGRSK